MKELEFDLVVIGGGMAGLPIANKAAYKGLKTALVEKELLGGTCLNRGCIPTKTMIHSAKVAHTVRTAELFGIKTSPPKVDLAAIVSRKNKIVETIRKNAYRQVKKNQNLTLIEATAVFEGSNQLSVGESLIEAEKFIINTGARPLLPPIKNLDQISYHTNRSLLELTQLPETLLVVGGGYIGVEFAQMFARFGSKVILFQQNNRLVPAEDPEISQVLLEVFRQEGIEVVTTAQVVEVAQEGKHITAKVVVNRKEQEYHGDTLLMATGRRPNTDQVGLELAGVQMDERGFILADQSYQTNQNHIWAIGDVTGKPMFTHSARDDAERLYQLLFKGISSENSNRIVPYAIFTDPEIAAVGMTEQEALDQGFEIKIGKHPFNRVARAMAMGSTAGFIKIVADASTDRILGAQIIGPHAGELIHEFVITLQTSATFQDIGKALHVHPTLAEGVSSAAGGVHRPAGD